MGTLVGGVVIVALIITVIVLGVLYSQKASTPVPPSPTSCLVPAVSTPNTINLKAMLDSETPNCPIGSTKMAGWLDSQGAQAVPIASSCPSGLKVPDTPPPQVRSYVALPGSPQPPPPSPTQSGVGPVQGAGFKLCVPNSFTTSSPALPADIGSEMMACAFAQANGQCSVM
jgi:hypothetical protein